MSGDKNRLLSGPKARATLAQPNGLGYDRPKPSLSPTGAQ